MIINIYIYMYIITVNNKRRGPFSDRT